MNPEINIQPLREVSLPYGNLRSQLLDRAILFGGNMPKLIPLNKYSNRGICAIVSDEDFERVSQFNWTLNVDGYVLRFQCEKIGNCKYKKHGIKLHRFVLDAPPDKIVDHINKNKLDCRRENLRLCGYSGNGANRKPNKNNKGSEFKGVQLKGNRWQAAIKKNGKWIYIGSFGSEGEAAHAYNNKAIELFGEFASLNKIKTAGEE